MDRAPRVPVWLKLAYGVAVPIIAVSYWYAYGPANYLWLSDIALVCTMLAVVTENRLLASMPAVGVLPLELVWTIDFLSGGRLIGLAAYMFDPNLSLYLRCLSGFHLALPPTLIWMLWRFGYDPRALALQTGVTWVALILSYLLTGSEKNINWVYGPGPEAQQTLPPLLYFGLEIFVWTLGILLPMHWLLNCIFPPKSA
jgi:hypothetical protein